MRIVGLASNVVHAYTQNGKVESVEQQRAQLLGETNGCVFQVPLGDSQLFQRHGEVRQIAQENRRQTDRSVREKGPGDQELCISIPSEPHCTQNAGQEVHVSASPWEGKGERVGQVLQETEDDVCLSSKCGDWTSFMKRIQESHEVRFEGFSFPSSEKLVIPVHTARCNENSKQLLIIFFAIEFVATVNRTSLHV
jgi:hypothetical protein